MTRVGRFTAITDLVVLVMRAVSAIAEVLVEFAATPVYSVWPLYGPAAGGTRVTISGQSVSVSTVAAVYIGQYRTHPDNSRFLFTTCIFMIFMTFNYIYLRARPGPSLLYQM